MEEAAEEEKEAASEEEAAAEGSAVHVWVWHAKWVAETGRDCSGEEEKKEHARCTHPIAYI